MANLLLYLPFLAPVLVANFYERDRRARYVTYALLVAINAGLAALAALALLFQFAETFMPTLPEPTGPEANWWGVAAACLSTSILAFLPLLPAFRRWLSRYLPFDPDSAVHTTALTFAIYEVGLSLGQLALVGDLEAFTDASLALTLWDVAFSGVPLTLFALLGVGLFVRRDGRGTLARLKLQRPTGRQMIAVVVVTALFLALDLAVNAAWQEVDPAGYRLVERINENLFGNLATVGGALVLGLSAGISEELLFRGAVQPRLGLAVATILFAIGHLQYGLTVATAEILVIGLLLGVMRNRTNTTVCILIHASYNTIGVLLGMLQG
jgi:membrane protease YdiL (CAAX protease family)